ncbi:MAG TPA: hypothetical protein VGK24_09550 [Candidatus Angelobacter sp.]|jgi:hypothetical protein
MSDISRRLDEFAKIADQLNSVLREIPMPEELTDDAKGLIHASGELCEYLSLIARKAENVASRIRMEKSR